MSHEMMNSRERRLSSWSNATCAMPLCEASSSRRGRGPHWEIPPCIRSLRIMSETTSDHECSVIYVQTYAMACQHERLIDMSGSTATPPFLAMTAQPVSAALGPPSIIAGSIYLSARRAIHLENISNSGYLRKVPEIYLGRMESLIVSKNRHRTNTAHVRSGLYWAAALANAVASRRTSGEASVFMNENALSNPPCTIFLNDCRAAR